MNVLIACEESQEVCKAFRERGHNAYSCDIQKCSGGHPEWHINMDAMAVINGGYIKTQNGNYIYIYMGLDNCSPAMHLFIKRNHKASFS